MRLDRCTLLVLPALVQLAHPFAMAPALTFSANNRDAGRHQQPGWRSRSSISSMKQPAPGSDRIGNNNNNQNDKSRSREREPTRRGRSISVSNSSQNRAAAKRPRRPPSTTPSGAPMRESRGSVGRERPMDNAGPGPPVADVHVIVPVKDVVAVPLTDISQAAADSLGGGEATRVSIERFCKTLESVCRTEFSVKVDRANAGSVLGGRGYGSAADRPRQTREELGASATSEIVSPSAAASSAAETSAGTDDKGKRGKWGMALRRGKQSKAAGGGGEKKEAFAVKKAAAVGRRRNGGSGSAGRKRNDNGGGGGDVDSADEIAVVPLLQLVEELVRNAMFSPIGARDVMMSQALAAEFPTAAGVRPVFGNLANVYELLRRRGSSVDGVGEVEGEGGAGAAAAEDDGSQGGGGGKTRISDSERAMLPFEGKLLMFRRGNGVEETKGRLLLKKLDYLQSNAVGWLSQSITDSLKACQQGIVAVVDTAARDFARRKDSVVRSCAEAAIAFGLERESMARFLPAANVTTELALTKEQEALNEALSALRRNSRRGVNLQRYGMRQVNVKLEEFSEGGAWPPGDDSWFWDTGGPGAALDEDEAGEDGFPAEGEEVPSAVLPRVTLASVLSPPTVPRRGPDEAASATSTSGSKISVSRSGSNSSNSKSTNKSVLKRLLSKCTVKEPTYDEVVVVYFKRTRRPIFRTPSAVAGLWRLGSRVGNRVRGVGKADPEPEDADEVKGAGLGLQLRVYRGVPLVNLNAIAPDKKVEVRPQTALRLDLNSVVGLGLVLANLRFDSPVLVAAATLSVVLLVIRTIVGYLNARIRVESFVSRDILDKTMGSNVPVLRHLAEEAAQQKSRHVALVYAALLQCTIDTCSEPATALVTGAGSAAGDGGVEWGDLPAVSVACVGRHCGAIMKACVGLAWEAKVDVAHWLKELENLKILVRVDGGEADPDVDVGTRRSLPLALEGLDSPPPAAATAATEAASGSSAVVVNYRLLDPDAAVERLKSKWSELVEPPAAASHSYSDRDSDSGGGGSSGGRGGDGDPPWARRVRALV
eukprot:g14627.t1